MLSQGRYKNEINDLFVIIILELTKYVKPVYYDDGHDS